MTEENSLGYEVDGVVRVWNMALGWLGTKGVASVDENVPEARWCRIYWDNARKDSLRAFPWNFAMTRDILAEVPLPEAWKDAWECAYAAPADCLKLHAVYRKGDTRPHPFRLISPHAGSAGSTGASIILTSATQAIAEFTRDIRSPAEWDAAFVHLAARRLASLAAISLLKNNSQKIQELEQLYRAAIPNTYEASASEQRQKPETDSWLAVRGEE